MSVGPSSALVAGDATLDLTLRIDHVPEPDSKADVHEALEDAGGIAVNAAVAAALAGANVSLLVALGDDRAGRCLAEAIGKRGVRVCAEYRPGFTSRVVSLIEPHGEKRLLLYPGVSMFPSLEAVEAVSLADTGWVHMAVYDIPAARALARRCRMKGIALSLDLEPSTFPGGIETLAEILNGAAAVFVNERSAKALGGEPVQILKRFRIERVIETRGAKGAKLTAEGRTTSFPAPQVDVADTTGAGDCLAGWFIAGCLAGTSADESLANAVIAASMSCARFGTQISYPSLADVQALRSRSLRSAAGGR